MTVVRIRTMFPAPGAAEPRPAIRVALLVAAIALATAGVAAQRDAKPQPAAAGSATIRGVVVGGDTGEPIRDAVVILRALDSAESELLTTVSTSSGRATIRFEYSGKPGQVDDEGRFELTDIRPGRYRLTVMPGLSAVRYLQTTYPDVDDEELPPVTVAAGQTIDGVRIALMRTGAISGRVLTDRGDPLSEVMVQVIEALPGGHRSSSPRPVTVAPTRSDDNGAFRIYGLRPGEYIVRAQAQTRGTAAMVPPGAPMQLMSVLRGPSTLVYYPGTISPVDAVRIRLQAGEERGPIDFVITDAKPITVRGVLLDPEGHTVGGMDIRVQRPGGTLGETGFSRRASADGTFEITGLFAGDHVFTAHRFSDGTRPSQFAWSSQPVHADIDGLTLQLQDSVTIRGEVTFEGEPPASWGRLQIQALPHRQDTGRSISGSQPDAARRFEIGNQFGPLFLRAEGMPDWHLKSVTYNGADITDQPTQFDSRTPVQILLTRRAASITGMVTTRKGTPVDAGVLVFSEDPATWHERALSTRLVFSSLAGAFTVPGLRPGRYLAIAVNRADAALTNAPASYFEALARHASPVTIDEAEQKTVTLTLVSLR
jgi:hypothetical protein